MDFSEGAIKTMENRGVKNVLYSDFFSCQEEQKFDTLLFLMNGIGIAKTLDGLSFFFEKCLQVGHTSWKEVLCSQGDSFGYNKYWKQFNPHKIK